MKRVGSWWVPANDAHLEEYLEALGGEYQQAHRGASLNACKRRRVAIDVGAHIGMWARDLAREFDEVVAFEPVAEFRQYFSRNVTADNVSLYPFALGKEFGRVRLGCSAGSSGTTHIQEFVEDGVEVRTLDSFAISMVDFIKIDVEGFELYVLEGARETLMRWRPVVTLEQKSHSVRHYGIEQYAALKYLESLGAEVRTRVVDDWVLSWPESGQAD